MKSRFSKAVFLSCLLPFLCASPCATAEQQPAKADTEKSSKTGEPGAIPDIKTRAEEMRQRENILAKAFEEVKRTEEQCPDMDERIQRWKTFLASVPGGRTPKVNEIRKYATERIKHLERWKAMGKTSPLKEIGRDGRFTAFEDGTVWDAKTDLMWAREDNGQNISWLEAKSYCEGFRLGGLAGWRMPTQNELAGLYDSRQSYRATQRNYDVHLTKLIQLPTCCLWASDAQGSEAAVFDFSHGSRYWLTQTYSYGYRVLPVRSGK